MPLSGWAERRRQADEERRRRVEERVEQSNTTMRAIADVALELRASADRLEDVLSDLNPNDLIAEIDSAPNEEVLERTRSRLDRLIQALEEERRRLQ